MTLRPPRAAVTIAPVVRPYTLALLAAFAACSRPPADSTPEGVVRAWLDHMEAWSDDPKEGHEAYALLGPAARANLEARAGRASQVQGRRAEPYDMLAEGRFGLKFRPKTMHSNIVGDRATVEVTGDDPGAEHATLRCVREANGWRVEPELPEATPLQKRGDAGP